MNDFENEKQALQHSVEVSRLLADTLEHHERENRRLWKALIVSMICNIIIAACMVWAVINCQTVVNNAIMNAQETFNSALSQALDAVAEIGVTTEETVTTTTVTQDTGEGTGNNVYQDGDNTTYNEAGGGE